MIAAKSEDLSVYNVTSRGGLNQLKVTGSLMQFQIARIDKGLR